MHQRESLSTPVNRTTSTPVSPSSPGIPSPVPVASDATGPEGPTTSPVAAVPMDGRVQWELSRRWTGRWGPLTYHAELRQLTDDSGSAADPSVRTMQRGIVK